MQHGLTVRLGDDIERNKRNYNVVRIEKSGQLSELLIELFLKNQKKQERNFVYLGIFDSSGNAFLLFDMLRTIGLLFLSSGLDIEEKRNLKNNFTSRSFSSAALTSSSNSRISKETSSFLEMEVN
jgi:hypothetical protein